MINPAPFILIVIIGGSPPQQRGEFHSYHQLLRSRAERDCELGTGCALGLRANK
jgi:hypothetical protein